MSRRRDSLRARAGELARRPAVRVGACALLAGATLAGFLVPLLMSRAHTPTALLEQPITIKRALSTTAALFGDHVEAEVDVYTAGRGIDPGSVRIRTNSSRPSGSSSTRIGKRPCNSGMRSDGFET